MERQWCGAEHFATKGYDNPLTHQYQYKHQNHSLILQEMAEGGVMTHQRLGIEEVPELDHHEGGEEHGQLMHIYSTLASALTLNQQGKQHEEEDDAAEQDAETDTLVDDEIGCLAWFILHHLVRWRQ